MKKHAYLIMAHGDWSLLSKLLLALDDPRNDIYVHIDRKSAFSPEMVYEPRFARIQYIKRISVTWGGDSLIKCELALLKAAINGNYFYYHLISGQDLPIKSQDEIYDFFEKNSGKNYVKIDKKALLAGYPQERIREYHFFQNLVGRKDGHIAGLLYRLKGITITLQKKLGIDRLRNCPKKIYKGTNWFSITHEMAGIVLSEERFIRKYCFWGFCADEIFLQTIAMNCCISSTCVDDDLRFIDWVRGNPYTFTMADFESLMNSDCLFARKFSDQFDPKITQIIVDKIREGDIH